MYNTTIALVLSLVNSSAIAIVKMIKNHTRELLAKKFGGESKVNLTQVQNETRLSYTLVQRWWKDEVDRFDKPVLETWCKYFGCQPGDILTYEG
jgi:DNA-binding Xre family transcriptional regulator